MNNLVETKNIFIFEGIGSKYRSIIRTLDKSILELLNKYYKIIIDQLGVDLQEYIYEDTTNNALSDNDNTFLEWILIFTCDCIIYKSYLANNIKPKMLVGYSMGLITAMVCTGSISFNDGLRVLERIYKYPKESKRDNEAMATIIGLNYKSIVEIIEDLEFEELLEISSENAEYCIGVSGVKNAINKILMVAEEQGALKTIKLDVPFAFHSKFALKGIETVKDLINNLEVGKATIPIMSVYTQNIIVNEEELRNELLTNLYNSMEWKKTIYKLGNMGIDNFVEVSLSDSLSKMSRENAINSKFITFKDVFNN